MLFSKKYEINNKVFNLYKKEITRIVWKDLDTNYLIYESVFNRFELNLNGVKYYTRLVTNILTHAIIFNQDVILKAIK